MHATVTCARINRSQWSERMPCMKVKVISTTDLLVRGCTRHVEKFYLKERNFRLSVASKEVYWLVELSRLQELQRPSCKQSLTWLYMIPGVGKLRDHQRFSSFAWKQTPPELCLKWSHGLKRIAAIKHNWTV